MARHLQGGTLTYNGWGGHGRQVRDLLHIDDLADLVVTQVTAFDRLDGSTFNVGGGRGCSLSLAETTTLCEAIAGRRIAIAASPDTRVADIKLYVTDNTRVTEATGWAPAAQCRAGAARPARVDDRACRTAAGCGPVTCHEPGRYTPLMAVALITGSAGLIGSEAVDSFAARGFDVVGIDNDMRRRFFGDEASTAWQRAELERRHGPALPARRPRHPRQRGGRRGSSRGTAATSRWSSTPRRSRRTTGPRASRSPTSTSTPSAR